MLKIDGTPGNIAQVRALFPHADTVRVASGRTPLETLKSLLDSAGMTGSDLGRLLGHRQLGDAILRGDRQLSKTHIRQIANHFHIDPAALL